MNTRAAPAVAVWSSRVLLAWAFVLVCVVQTRPALAQQGADARRYRELIGQALQDFDRGNWEEAGALFAQAHALNPNARTLRGMGLAAFEARHYAKALQHLRAALDEKRFALTSDQRKSVEQAIERADHYVGRVHFTLEPTDTQLKIDGEAIELDAQGEFVTDPGLLDVEASAAGYDTQLRRVQVSSGATEQVAIKLVTEDQEVAERESAPADTQAAPHATATDGDSGGGNPIGTIKWLTGGLAVAAIATGTIALVLRDSEAKQWNRCLDDRVASCVEHRDAANTERTIGIVGLAAGGAFAVATVVLFVIDARRAEPAATALRACGPGASEISLRCGVAF